MFAQQDVYRARGAKRFSGVSFTGGIKGIGRARIITRALLHGTNEAHSRQLYFGPEG